MDRDGSIGRRENPTRDRGHAHNISRKDGYRNYSDFQHEHSSRWRDTGRRGSRGETSPSRSDAASDAGYPRENGRDRNRDRVNSSYGDHHRKKGRLDRRLDQRGADTSRHSHVSSEPEERIRSSRTENARVRGRDKDYQFEAESFRAEEASHGIYGPADSRQSSGGDRGWVRSSTGGRPQVHGVPRDENWVQYRLNLRAEARPPKGVWNRSPSPPHRRKTYGTKTTPDGMGNLDNKSRMKNTRAKQGKRNDADQDLNRFLPPPKDSKIKSSHCQPKSDSATASSSSDSDSSGKSSTSSDDGTESDRSSDSSSNSSSDSSHGRKHSSRMAKRSYARERGKIAKTHRIRSISGVEQDEGASKVPRTVTSTSSDPCSPQRDVDSTRDIGSSMPASTVDEIDAAEAAQFKADVQGHRFEARDSDDDAGPMPVPQLDELQGEGDRGVNYGGALLPGEGAAIAQFVQKGLRIPRRGEVGWAGNEIEKLESSGYVMSGSRHARMNAVRLRKENQVFNAEERRALALIMFEEKQQKENEILGNFRQMLTEANQDGVDKASLESKRKTS